jgi:hypothetical protein
MGAGLARKEECNKDGEEHHVASESRKQEEANFMKQFAWTAAIMLPIIVAATASTAGGPAIERRLAADSRFFPFRFRRGMRKGSGHQKPLCNSDYTTFRWTQRQCKWMAFLLNSVNQALQKGLLPSKGIDDELDKGLVYAAVDC